MTEALEIEIRTPHEVVLHDAVASARVPTETGLVGLRPGGEPLVLAVEPGLVLLRRANGEAYAATAGGLLESGRTRCLLLTPYAVAGGSASEMEQALDQILTTPSSELLARRRLEELEQRILRELKERPRSVSREVARG